ncbi:MAG: acyl-CoA thioesterase [Halolamina sp.]
MPFETELDVRFRDLDALGHVNNAVYATYLEQARVEYFERVVGVSLSAVDSVLATLSLDYERPIRKDGDAGDARDGVNDGDQTVRVTVSVPRLGDSSVPMEYEVYDPAGRLAATGETVQVAYDSDAAAARPLPESWREAIVDHEGI